MHNFSCVFFEFKPAHLICPPTYEKIDVVTLFVKHNRKFNQYVSIDNIKTVQDL